MSTEAKVGAFVLAGMMFMAVAIFLLGDFTFENRYVVYVTFSDVAGLSKSAPVKLSGVDVGQVKDVLLENGRAKVVASVRTGVDIYENATIEIGLTGIIGSRFLQINQGTPGPGIGMLAPGAIVRGEDPVAIDKALTKALQSFESMLADLNGDGGKPNSLGRNLNDTVRELKELTSNLNDIITASRPHLQEALTRTDAITEKLDQLLAKSNEVMAGLATDKGTAGAFIHDKDMKADVKQTVGDLKEVASTARDVFSRVNQFKLYWNMDWRYEHQIRTARSDIGIKIEPRPGRYYYLGGSNLMNISDQRRGKEDYAQPNRVDALLGWQWAPVDLGVGVIRSGGGARVTVTPLWEHPVLSKVSLTAQAYDFGRNRTVEGRKFTRGVWDFGFMVRPHRVVGIGGRVEDVREVKRFQSWLNVNFEDKDLAYLFGLVSFGAAGTKGRSKNK